MRIIRAFKTLVNELFGTKKEYQVKDLCVFICKVCDWWLDKLYFWTGIVRLPFYAEETMIRRCLCSVPPTIIGIIGTAPKLAVYGYTIG